jgi:hypothetical protein
MKVVVNSLFLKEHPETLKLAALYCDKIILPDFASGWIVPLTKPEKSKLFKGLCVASWSSIPKEVNSDLKTLVSENIAVKSRGDEHVPQGTLYDTYEDIKKLLFYTDPATGKLINNFSEIAEVALGYSKCVRFTKEDLEKYYSLYDVIHNFFSFCAENTLNESIHHDSPILTDSQVVKELILNYLSTERLTKRYNLAKHKSMFLSSRILQEFIPNVGVVPIDDILEVRHKMTSELEAFRNAIAKLSADINSNPWSDEIEHDADKIIETKIKPSINDLRKSLEHSRWKIIQKVFDNIKDPTTYVPLIGTVMAGIDPSIALLASMGIAGFRSFYDFYLEKKSVKDSSGLLFLLKAPRKLRNTSEQS